MNIKQALAIGYCGAALSCSSTQRQQAVAAAGDAAAQQRAICALVEAWAPASPELEPAAQSCREGKNLKLIAATYAECTSVPQ